MSDEKILVPSDDEILDVKTDKDGNIEITDVGVKESEKIIDESGKDVPYNIGPM